MNLTTSKPLSVFSLVMINVIAVDSLRSLTAGAEYGLALVSFYLISAILFFIPTILVTAELATGWPNTGGVYIWVREAFGAKVGFLIIWLQWVYNLVWFPTIFAFMAGVLAYLIEPSLVNNKTYMLTVILSAVWLVTIINCCGIKVSSLFSALGAIVGTLFPMILIAMLGFYSFYTGKYSQPSISVKDFLPTMENMGSLAFLTNILFGLMGMEMSAVHAGDVQNPKQNYPRALLISGSIIFLTLVSACLAIALVIPAKELNLVSGLLDAFHIFFNTYHMNWFMPVIAMLIILGSLSGAAAWMIGPARGLYVATRDNELPKVFQRVNKKNMPVGVLLMQAIIVTLLCVVFLLMPSVNSSYWILSNMTAQLGLLFYILMFAAAIRLRFKHNKVERSYRIPGGKLGMCLVAGIAIITCILTIFLGFIPPANMEVGKVVRYEIILVAGIILFCIPPFFLHKRLSSQRR